MKKLFCVTFLVTIFLSLHAQDEKKEETPEKKESKVSISPITAQFMISTNFDAVCLNMVGTGIRYNNRNFTIALSLFPTLVFREDPTVPDPGDPHTPFIRPGFAVGPMFQYKKLIIGFPTFYQDDEWHPTVGVGVKIGK